MSTVDPEQYRAASLAQWEGSAAGWGKRAKEIQRTVAPVSLWMIEAIDPQPGHTVLELAAGPGETGFLAAELVRPGGRLICTDFAEPMLDVARARAEELGLRNVEFRRLDAESMDVDTAAIDRVLCRWGYMLMADPEAALRETRRVLRPGGRLALAAWSVPAENPWASLAGRVVRRRLGAPEPDPAAPGMFAFGRPG
nr:methyltransferase domain-containing protein [Actinomycetota bacterium]